MFCCQVCTYGLGIIDGEHGVDFCEARQVALHHAVATFARTFCILIIGQYLDSGCLCENTLATVDPVQDCGSLRSVLDNNVTLATQLLGNVLADYPAGFDVICLYCSVGTLHHDIYTHNHDAGLSCFRNRRRNCHRVDGIDKNQVDAR
ncbi:hypothetical protein D3C84_819310 [compost metagenome]